MKFRTTALLSFLLHGTLIPAVAVATKDEMNYKVSKPALRGVTKHTIDTNKMDEFKKRHDLKDDAHLPLQIVRETANDGGNIVIVAKGGEYSLTDLEPMEIYSKNATYLSSNDDSDEPKPVTSFSAARTYTAKNGTDTIMVTKGPQGDVRTIDIMGSDGSDIYMVAVEPGVLATINPDSVDVDSLKKFNVGDMMYDHDEDEDGCDNKDRKLAKKVQKDTKKKPLKTTIPTTRNLQSSCPSYKVIEVATAFDSTFCTSEGGETSAKEEIERIVARASLMYQTQGVCAKLVISHMEANCDASSDPYAEGRATGSIGCSGSGLLQSFQNHWRTNKSGIGRDAAHLFYSVDLSGSTVGCAYVNALCSSYSGYGVNEMEFTNDELRRAIVFAHELGHNVGLDHVSSSYSTRYIMDSVGFGEHVWSPQSLTELNNLFPTHNCISSDNNGGGDDDDNTGDDDDVCTDSPVGWHDIDGSNYNCEWYAQGSNCAAYGDSYRNGKTANEACCVCGGGSTGEPNTTQSPSAAPSEVPTIDRDDECNDNPFGWHDRDGPSYNCEWYAQGSNCATYGDSFENDGKTANEACCVCGGGGSSEPPKVCSDNPAGWHDIDGPTYDCDWYAQGSNCAAYGDSYRNDGKTANEACCACGGGSYS